MTARVVVCGSANLDQVMRVEALPGPGATVLASSRVETVGGLGVNQAVAAARCGAEVVLVGVVGDDPAGALVRGAVRAAGVDDTHLVTRAGRTGQAIVVVAVGGENLIVVDPGCNAEVGSDVLDAVAVAPGDVVVVSAEWPLDAVAGACAHARRAGATVLLNASPVTAGLAALAGGCDVVVGNREEMARLAVLGASNEGPQAWVVTLGAEGAEVRQGASRHREPGRAVTAVDTAGCGDAFLGALAARLAAGATLTDAARVAVAVGALTATVAGTSDASPRLTDVAARWSDLAGLCRGVG